MTPVPPDADMRASADRLLSAHVAAETVRAAALDLDAARAACAMALNEHPENTNLRILARTLGMDLTDTRADGYDLADSLRANGVRARYDAASVRVDAHLTVDAARRLLAVLTLPDADPIAP